MGSIICAAARSSPIFITGRAIAGIVAAGLLQGALAIVTYIAPLEERPLYIGLVVSVFGISACGGPILGGALADHIGWRWCFSQFSVFPDNPLRNRRNAPLGVSVLILIFCSLKLEKTDGQIPNSLRNKLHSLDPMGIGLLLGAVCCLLLVLQQGGTLWPWNSAKIIGLLAGFSILSIAFGFVQRRLGERATISVRILRDRTVLSGSLFLALSSSSSCVVSLSSCQFSCMVRSLIHTTDIMLSPISLPSRSRFFGHTKRSPISGAGPTSDDRLDYYKCSDNEN